MQINSICVNSKYSNVSFKSNPIVQKKQNSITNLDENQKKILTGLAGLAIIGAASVATVVLKKKNTTPLKLIKKSFSNLAARFSDKPTPDPIIQKLEGKRDAEAVRLYKGYKAQDKLNSLHNKLLSGQFDKKTQHVFACLQKNERQLRREAAVVM